MSTKQKLIDRGEILASQIMPDCKDEGFYNFMYIVFWHLADKTNDFYLFRKARTYFWKKTII
jgi:hypothetical protein